MEIGSYKIGQPTEQESKPGEPKVSKSVNPPDKNCGDCIFMAQGYGSAFCCNPNQTDKDLKEYIYYIFCCPLFCEGGPKGLKPSDDQFMINLGYERKHRNDGWPYWELKK